MRICIRCQKVYEDPIQIDKKLVILSNSDNPTVWTRRLALLWVSVTPKKTKALLLFKMWEINKL